MTVQTLNKNPGILPFELGPARITAGFHTFIHFVDIPPLENQIENISNQYEQLKSTISNELSDIYKYALQNFYSNLEFQMKTVTSKFLSIHPHPKRIKRGLINGLGSVIKGLTGLMDNEDSEKLNTIISELRENQNNLIRQNNKHLSLTNNLIKNVNETIALISHNQEIISDKIVIITKELDKTLFDFTSYMEVRDALDQIRINLEAIHKFLLEIENSISFARIGVLHTSIVSLEEIDFIVQKMILTHSENQIIYAKPNQYFKYYDIVRTSVFLTEDKIIFSLDFPLVFTDSFTHFRLFPIPTANNTVIIPQNSYFTKSDTSYQYEENPCQFLNPEYLCSERRLADQTVEPDCIFSVLNIDAIHPKCHHVKVQVHQAIIEEINKEYYIGIFPTSERLQTICGRNEIFSLKGSYLFKVPAECKIQTTTYSYINTKGTLPGHPLLLPNVHIANTTLNLTRKVDLLDTPLDKLHQLQLQSIVPMDEPGLNWKSSPHWIWPSYAILFFITIILVTAYYIKHHRMVPNSTIQQTSHHINDAQVIPPLACS